jgi:Protein of unknown function (DUF2946).
MAAMWLTIVAPVVSQTLPSSRSTPAHGASCGGHAGDVTHPSSPHSHLMEKCGYCGLLSHSPTLTGAVWLPQLLPPVIALPHDFPKALPWMRNTLLAAAPRGPPAFVSA